MKLNLLPQTVSTANKSRNAWIGSILIAIVGIAAGVGLTVISSQKLADAKAREAELRPQAASVVALAAQADEVIAKGSDIIRNSTLANDMIRNNVKYPDLYDKVLTRIPTFFRVTTLSAQATGDQTAVVTIDGVLDTYQQYSDLALSLLRIPGVTSVQRSGIVDRNLVIPGINEVDQYGRPRTSNASEAIPDNEIDRLAYYERQGAIREVNGIGGFGDTTTALRAAGPNSSLVRMVINISANLQVPDVRGTLQGSAGGAAPAAPGVPAGIPGRGATTGPGGGGGRSQQEED